MNGPIPPFDRSAGEPHRGEEDAAIQWLARRDRGFAAGEERQFVAWLAADPKNAAAWTRIGAIWGKMDRLQSLSAQTNNVGDPDLLARRHPPRSWRLWGAAAAAVLLLGFVLSWPRFRIHFQPTPEVVAASWKDRLTFSDGSIAELAPGAKIAALYTPSERRVRLVAGQATFSVVKNSSRPFIVSAGTINVRAVGTVFAVRLESDGVQVAVTDGRVRAERQDRSQQVGPAPTVTSESVFIAAGHWAVIPTAVSAAIMLDGKALSPPSLAPVGNLLVFSGQPLSEVAAEFNRHNRRQLLIANPETGALRIGGTFNAQNLDPFLRVLSSLGVAVESRGDGSIVLRKSM